MRDIVEGQRRAGDGLDGFLRTAGSGAVEVVLGVAGHRLRAGREDLPAGLTERGAEVLRAICRGATKKDVAAQLSISPNTVDHHVRHVYEKAGVRTRAGATLFALEHDILK